jgi:hypothetical protein
MLKKEERNNHLKMPKATNKSVDWMKVIAKRRN